MDWLAISWNDCHAVSLDCHLRRADWSECVDHAEPIAPARSNGEYFEWCVCHKACVGITELALAVYQHRLGILTRVDGQAARVALCCILVQPVADEHYVRGQVKVVQMRVGIPRGGLTDHNTAVQTVEFLQAGVGMPEMCARVARPLIPECVALLNGTLGDEWHAIVVLGAALPDAVPVYSHFHALHVVLHVDDNLVVLAHLDTGTRYHAVRRQNATLDSIGQNTLTVTPNGIRSVRRAHLTGTVNKSVDGSMAEAIIIIMLR